MTTPLRRTPPARRTSLAAGLCALTLTLAACSGPAPTQAESAAATVVVENAKPTLVLTQEDGETSLQEDPAVPRGPVEVPANPSAVVTFDLSTLDTMHTIGAGGAIVGIPDATLPDYLAEYRELPKVGTLFEPDFEAVAELNPDLIVTAARSTSVYDELAEIATTIDLTAAFAGTFDPAPAIERATQLGELFGREQQVEEAVAEIEALESDLVVAADGTALVLSVSGGEYGAFGEGSRFGYFFDTLGFVPAVAAADLPGEQGSPHGDAVTNEFLLTTNPDWIFAFDRGAATGDGSTAEAALDNELVNRTTAAQEGHLVLLPASELYTLTNGLTAIGAVLQAVDDAVRA